MYGFYGMGSMEPHGIPWNSMKIHAMQLHGFHRTPRIAWNSMEHLELHGLLAFTSMISMKAMECIELHGNPWNPWAPWIPLSSTGSMEFLRIPWSSMESMHLHGIAWNLWNFMECVQLLVFRGTPNGTHGIE